MGDVELLTWEIVKTKEKVCPVGCRCSPSCLMVEEWARRPLHAPSNPFSSLWLKESSFAAEQTLDPKGVLLWDVLMEAWQSGKEINTLPRPLDGECNLFRQINNHTFPFLTPGELIGVRHIWQKKLAHDYKFGHRSSSRCISYPVPTCSVIMWAMSAGHWQGERSWICPLKHSAGEQCAQEFTFVKAASSAGSTRCAEAAALCGFLLALWARPEIRMMEMQHP